MSELEKNKQVVRDFFTALNTFDAEGIMKTLAEDVTLRVMGTSCLSGTYGLHALPQVTKYLAEACPGGITFTIKALTAEENRVSCMVDGQGELAAGGNYINNYHFLFEFRDGKICGTYEFMDTLMVENIFGPVVKAQQQ